MPESYIPDTQPSAILPCQVQCFFRNVRRRNRRSRQFRRNRQGNGAASSAQFQDTWRIHFQGMGQHPFNKDFSLMPWYQYPSIDNQLQGPEFPLASEVSDRLTLCTRFYQSIELRNVITGQVTITGEYHSGGIQV